MGRSTSRLSESEREQRRARDRERLKVAAEQLLTSEGWERWVHVRSRNGLSRYSVNNQLLIALARPDATFVAGCWAWLELGYQVRKGEKAIWILAPLKIKERDRLSGEETGDTGETIPYVAGWSENGALEAVTEFAATIDKIARQIEQAIDAGVRLARA
jgi:hypothetical protein